jgi:hypothetical protein
MVVAVADQELAGQQVQATVALEQLELFGVQLYLEHIQVQVQEIYNG